MLVLDLFASSVAGIGDVDGDGRADVAAVVCSWGSDFETVDEPGPGVAAYSGADGKLLWTGAVGLHTQRFSKRALCSVGDVDGDGRGDLAVLGLRKSSPPADPPKDFVLEVAVLSGLDGSILRSWPVESGLIDAAKAEIACVGDQDGDASSDLAVVAATLDKTGSGGGSRSAAWIQSCKTGEVIRWMDQDPVWWMTSEGIETPGDLDADGYSDLAILSYARSGTPVNPYELHPTAVVVWSGRNGNRRLVIDTPKHWFQVRFCGAGDVDHDGHPDVALAGHASRAGSTATTWETRIHSGRDGQHLRSIPGVLEAIKCGDLACTGDVDRDGTADLVISEFVMITGGIVNVHSGKDGARIRTSSDPGEYFGYSINAAGDVDADGVPDWVVGQCNPWGDMGSRMIVVSGREGRSIWAVDRTSLAATAKPR